MDGPIPRSLPNASQQRPPHDADGRAVAGLAADPLRSEPGKNDAAVDRMCGAIREFGFRIPIVARSDGTVVDGHLRLKAALRLWMTHVPVALADELSEAQIKAFRLLANRSATWAEWDESLLQMELGELR